MTYSEYRASWLANYPDMPEEEIKVFWAEVVDYEKRQETAWKKVADKYEIHDDFAYDKGTGKWCPLEAVTVIA